MKLILKKVDGVLGSPIQKYWNLYNRHKYELSIENAEKSRLNNDRVKRLEKYASSNLTYLNNSEIKKAVGDIEQNGYTIVRKFTNSPSLKKAKDFLQTSIENGEHLKKIVKDSARKEIDLGGAEMFFNENEYKRGEMYFRQHTNYIAVEDPLFFVPEIAELAFHPFILSVVNEYLKCMPALGGLNLRKSYANSLPEYDTLYFHSDKNSPKFLKVFFYLNDVNEKGGPFCFVKGSHKKKFLLWMSKYRWTYEEMVQKYGADLIQLLTANVGDMIIADTTGFHRGTKISGDDRYMLTLNYVLHPEFKGNYENIRIPTSVYEKLSPTQQAACDFLEKA